MADDREQAVDFVIRTLLGIHYEVSSTKPPQEQADAVHDLVHKALDLGGWYRNTGQLKRLLMGKE